MPADMRTCRTCGETKPIDEFDVRADTGRRVTECKACRRAYQKAAYASRRIATGPREKRVAGATELLPCTRCRLFKPASEFPRRRRDGAQLQSWCRTCFATVKRAAYLADADARARARSRARRRRAALRANVRAFIAAHPCGCGETSARRIRIVDSAGKTTTAGRLVASGRSWRKIEAQLQEASITCVMCAGSPRLNETRAASARMRTTPSGRTATRTCSRCGVEKPLAEFAPKYRAAPRASSWCRSCAAAYQEEWYLRNRDKVLARVALNRTNGPMPRVINFVEVRRLRWEYLLSHPCVDCGQNDAMVLQFDHRSAKRAGINELLRAAEQWSDIFAEIAKCDVRCANCHRRRTAITMGYYKDLLDPMKRASAPIQRRRRWEYLLAHPCVDCGETDPVVLEFDHRSGKRAAISDLMRRHANWTTVLSEIEKCDVRCANCHKRRTAQAYQHYFELVAGDDRRVSDAA